MQLLELLFPDLIKSNFFKFSDQIQRGSKGCQERRFVLGCLESYTFKDTVGPFIF